MTAYLRMEGVNLSSFVYDTNDLSTIRGGGLLLLLATQRVAKRFSVEIEPISTGASAGLFMLKPEARPAATLRREIERFLMSNEDFKHATFVVNVIDDRNGSIDFPHVCENLVSKNRFQQMQSPSLVVPDPVPGAFPCSLDRLRPARQLGTDEVSLSVHRRREYGRRAKRVLYSRILKDVLHKAFRGAFVNDFAALTSDETRGNLHHKMAVIYADGNKFGSLQRKARASSAGLRAFDGFMKERRASLLAALLENIQSRPGFKAGDDLRLETLLWGGDEFLWVVPAWEGWRTLSFFFDETSKWPVFPVPGGRGDQLTHSAGLVFCDHKAPIARIRQVAESLATAVKHEKPGIDGFLYLCLESFDHPGADLERALLRRLPPHRSVRDLVLSGSRATAIHEAMVKLKREIPKSKVHECLKWSLSPKEPGGPSPESGVAATLSGSTRQALDSLRGAFGNALAWLHIADLWDYLEEG
ncbi:MAG: hypothetical protein L6R30_22050 [Thermoanaerobaculia bacterium]|nr:hypothetical protein [Thermoanaerobaculia bacterium]